MGTGVGGMGQRSSEQPENWGHLLPPCPPITCAALRAEHQERRAGRLPQGHEGEGEMGKWKISILQLSQDGRGDRSQAGGRKPQDGMA